MAPARSTALSSAAPSTSAGHFPATSAPRYGSRMGFFLKGLVAGILTGLSRAQARGFRVNVDHILKQALEVSAPYFRKQPGVALEPSRQLCCGANRTVPAGHHGHFH